MAKYEVNKDLRVGAAYYFFRNNSITTNANDFTAPNSQQDVKLSNFGLNAEYTTGPLTLNGFGILQAGHGQLIATPPPGLSIAVQS